MLVDRRDELGRARTQTVNRLHRPLLELFPGGAKKFLSATQARALVATIKPRDIVGKTRRRLVVELITELESIDKKIKAAEKDLRELVIARGPLCWTCTASARPAPRGCWPTSVTSTASPAGNDSRPGTAPHRWTHRPANSNDTAYPAPATAESTGHCRVYFDSKKAAGNTSMEAMQALKRRLSNVVYARMLADQKRREAAGSGGHSGTTLQSSVTGLTPDTGPSDKPQPEPATSRPTPARTTP
jgi:transposase